MANGRDHDYWNIILYKLRNANLNEIRYEFPDYRHHDLLKAIEVSLDAIKEEQIGDLDIRARYLEFAVFPEDIQIPKKTLLLFWKSAGLREDQIDDLIKLLVDRSLCRRDENGLLILHDLQLDYVRRRFAGDLVQLHNRLLKSYQRNYPDEWMSTLHDGYFPQNLAYHLIEAGRENELKKISKQRRGRFFIAGIGGFGGKMTQLFIERSGSSRIDKIMKLIKTKSYFSEDVKGIWIEFDKDDAMNRQHFFGSIVEGSYPGFFIPHEIIKNGSEFHISIRSKYGYDVKKQGFVRDPFYMKAILEIFDSDSEMQTIWTSNSKDKCYNPILNSTWNAIKPFTTLGGGECDGIIFIVSFGGGTGGGIINPLINHIRNEIPDDYPIFVLGVLTDMDDNSDRAQFSPVGRRNLAASSVIYDLLTNCSKNVNGVMLIDNQILSKQFGSDYGSINKFIRKMMLPMVLGRDYIGETEHAQFTDYLYSCYYLGKPRHRKRI